MAIRTALFSKVLRDRSLEEAAELVAEIGYDGFEPMCRDPHLDADRSLEEVTAFRDHLDDLGLEVPCLATYTGHYVGKTREECEAELETFERFLEFADVLDCGIVRHGPGGPPVREATDDDYEHAASWLARAADRAAEYDVTIGIEIHAHTIAETVDSTQRLLAEIDRKNVGAIHDAGNMYITLDDFGLASVRELGDNLVHVHVKDEQRIDDPDRPGAFELETDDGLETFQPRLLGEGAVDHGPLFDALAEAGYDGYVTGECHVPRDELEDEREVAEHELAELNRLLG
ncbi:sugar phosphate isomerase/epimerase family protein [Natrialba taiwanensis]|uniref:Xylose isomerase domain-containing protein n=1 Tax=Natrialba taiwanensis DSM 12281 TaxID=1230458 RepID=M0A0K9_9EURY|nr:sugar phosphate isomerase/epimerase [Natrialba taiwanensis]ELY91866.1 xylose isomerase domain-containing protein [Natrialba taiwanensis DSM 12281]